MQISAGLLMFRRKKKCIEFFLAHHGSPFWKNKDKRAWTIPKGIVEDGEGLLDCAKREFQEETGIKLPEGDSVFISLGSVKQKSGKVVHAWAFEKDWSGKIKSNLTEIEWPPKTGKKIRVPEIDNARFFSEKDAREKIIEAQAEFIDRLEEFLQKIS